MKKYLLPILLAITFICLLVVIFSKTKCENELEQYKGLLKITEHENKKSFEKVLTNLYKSQFRFANSRVPKGMILQREDGTAVLLEDLQKQYRKNLMFVFSFSNCDVCVDKEIIKVKNRINSSIKNGLKIFVIGKFWQPHHLELFKQKHKLNFEILNPKDEDSFIDLNSPFYFILDSDFLLKDLFIPSKELPDVTGVYFELMNQKHKMIL